MVELIEQAEKDTSERQSPALTAALSAILAEVKDLRQKVNTLLEPDELDELETGEEPGDGHVIEDNDDNESLDVRLAKLGSTPAETTKDGMNSLLQDIASDLDISKRTGSPVNEGIAKIVLSLLKDKIPEEKMQKRIEKHP